MVAVLVVGDRLTALVAQIISKQLNQASIPDLSLAVAQTPYPYGTADDFSSALKELETV